MSLLRHSLVVSASAFLIFSPLSSMAAESTLKGFKIDSKQPIEINSDSLSVDNNQQSATFNGNVQVAQGTLRLKTSKLTVLYKSSGEKKPASAESAGAATPAGTTDSIRSLTADGNVFVTSDDSSAKGNRAVYQVPEKKLVMTGNVVLSQGANVLQGETLNVNLATGVSTITGGGSNGRVRTVFKPAAAESKK